MPRHSPKWEETSLSTVARWALGMVLIVLLASLVIPH